MKKAKYNGIVCVRAYHGTDSAFKMFDEKYKGSNTAFGNTVHGFFFTEQVKNAALFGNRIIEADIVVRKAVDFRLHSIFNKKEQVAVICEILFDTKLDATDALSLLNDEIGLGELQDMQDGLNTVEANTLLRQHGYDGIVSDMGNNCVEYTVFDKEQIRIIRDFCITKKPKIESNIKPRLS